MRSAKYGLKAMVAALVVLASARPTEAQNPGEMCSPFSTIIPGDTTCTGEDIFVSGETCIDVFPHLDASGGVHLTSHASMSGTGVGLTSGNTYVFRIEADIEDNRNLGNNAQDEATTTSTGILISQGSLPNEIVTVTLHETIDANGNITSMVVDITDDCHG